MVLREGMQYLVLIGDVVASRQLASRGKFQQRLKAALKTLNGRGRALASPYTVTLGDEFQAVYREPAGVMADLVWLMAQVAPVRMRFALGVGELVTPVNPVQAIGMDGPAFHRARARLDALKREKRLVGVGGAEAGRWALVEPVLAVLSGLIEGWKPNRLELFAGLLAGEGGAALARRIGITPRAVNKSIRAADLDEWACILAQVEAMLAQELKTR